jgi:hypothetical protein
LAPVWRFAIVKRVPVDFRTQLLRPYGIDVIDATTWM